MNLYLNALLSITLSCLIGTISAQETELQFGEKKDERKAWFVQTSIPQDVENPVKVLIGEEIQMVTLSNRVASTPVPIPKSGLLRIVKEIPHPEEEGETIYQSLAEAEIPANSKEALIIMNPIEKRRPNGPVFRTKVISLNNFQGGDYMYINLTRSRIGIQIDDKKLALKPGGLEIISLGQADKPVSIPYRYSYYHRQKEKWMPLNASMTISSRTRREIFIFSVSDVTRRIRCKGITFEVDQPG